MEIRPIAIGELDRLMEIDGTIESSQYVHVERAGEGIALNWRLEERSLRTKLIDRNVMDDETHFLWKQIISGIEEGLALLGEHDGQVVASLLAQVQPSNSTLRLIDLRVDYDLRRNGLGTALLYRAIQEAKDRKLRAVAAQTLTNNLPAGRLLLKAGFELAGLDVQLQSNHDLVKEAVSLFWYSALD